ncbi:MAG: hypothetical protein HDS78_03360 [Bacteroidales bacterium]|nr:hypothetical protein [Bacteroidales bacterium]
MKNYKSINEAVKHGDFTEFNGLNEDEKVENMKSWTPQMWDSYYLQNTISEDDVFNAIYKIIDNSEK